MHPKTRKTRIERGACWKCGTETPNPGKRTCESCCAIERDRNKQRKGAWREQGLCSCCGKERGSNDGAYCTRCRDKYRERYSKHYRKQRYGLTLEAFHNMLTAQSSGCAICGYNPYLNEDKSLCVDHDHETGAVRALLCSRCNTALGSVKEKVSTLLRMVEYLYKHKEQSVTMPGS